MLFDYYDYPNVKRLSDNRNSVFSELYQNTARKHLNSYLVLRLEFMCGVKLINDLLGFRTWGSDQYKQAMECTFTSAHGLYCRNVYYIIW